MDQKTEQAEAEAKSGSPFLSFLFGGSLLDRVSGVAPWVVGFGLMAPRLWLAWPFMSAGLTRYNAFSSGDWESQVFLFQYEHPVPYLPPEIAAYVTMAGELALPVLLALGLFGRLGALGLAAMAATIYVLLPAPYSNGAEQLPWIVVGALLFITGPGRLSIDYLIRRFVLRT